MSTITADHIDAWHRDGYVVIEDFLDQDKLRGALDELRSYYPSWDDYAADPQGHAATVENPWALNDFPYRGDVLNDLTVDPDILGVVSEQLGTEDVRLATSLIWAKYGAAPGLDQVMHVDYPNNTLVYPRDDGIYRQMPFILYFTDVTEDLGPTHVVSQQLTGTDVDTVTTPTSDGDRTSPEAPRYAWYQAERPVTVRAGSLLMYSMRTFHRGTAMRRSDGVRLSLHLVYRAASCQFMGWRSPARDANTPEMRRFLLRATPAQRQVINFPAPGDPYWNEESLAGVAARYPEMDLAPYREQMGSRPVLAGR